MAWTEEEWRAYEAENLRVRASRSDLANKVIDILRGLGVSSTNRLDVFMSWAPKLTDTDFWVVFESEWSACDATAHHWPRLLRMLKKRQPFPGNDFLQGLPDRITVYRGCARTRVAGLSWSTSPDVANKFARGHRFIPVQDPVIARGIVAKKDILFADNSRKEFEILADAKNIQGLEIAQWGAA